MVYFINQLAMMVICIWMSAFVPKTCAVINIEDYGAIASIDDWDIAVLNSNALLQAINAANISRSNSSTEQDRTVQVSCGKTYYMSAVNITDIHHVTLQIFGKFIFSNKIQLYNDPGTKNRGLLDFHDCSYIHLTGNHNIAGEVGEQVIPQRIEPLTSIVGEIDGQGLNWWRYAYTGSNHDNRPHLISFTTSYQLLVDSLYLHSSPKFTVNLMDCRDVVIHDLTIYINTTLVRGNGNHRHTSVVYALNTDGIDIAAYNVTVYNNNITNYDDAIVAKPCRANWKYCICSGHIKVYNNTITYSTGLTIGSVPPHRDINCIRNVTFQYNQLHRPLKAIYIKSNPGDEGNGIIEDILYEHIDIDHALWWTIYMGLQQQNQPGRNVVVDVDNPYSHNDATGCNFLFPFIPICPTQPLVSMNNISFRHIHAVETIPLFESPGVILCDAMNPCKDIFFEDVTNTIFTGTIEDIYAQLPIFYIPGILFPTPLRSDDWDFEYISSNVYGTFKDSFPVPCLNDPLCFWTSPHLEQL